MMDRPRSADRNELIAAELEHFDRQWAALFRRALGLYDAIDDPVNVIFLAHSGRELARSVIATLADVDVDTLDSQRGEPDAQATERDQGEAPRDEDEPSNGYATVIARALDRPQRHQDVRDWKRAYDAFVGCAHLRNARQRPPDPERVTRAFDTITSLMFGRLAPHLSVRRELDELLAVNVPTDSHLSRLRALQVRPANRTYFYSRLEHPGWFAPLRDSGFLTASRETAGGEWPAWTEAAYLYRMAPVIPDEVAGLIRSTDRDHPNALMWRLYIGVIGTLPIAIGRTLVPTVRRALARHSESGLVEEALRFATSLTNAGALAEARNILRDLLEVTPDEGAAGRIFRSLHFRRLGWFEIETLSREVLPRLRRGHEPEFVKWMAAALNRAIETRRRLQAERPTGDDAELLRELIGSDESVDHDADAADTDADESVADDFSSFYVLHDRDMADDEPNESDPIAVLAHWLVAACIEGSVGDASPVLRVLSGYRDPLFRRVEMRTLASRVGADSTRTSELVQLMLDDERYTAVSARDSALFLRACWPEVSAETQAKFSEWVQAVDRPHLAASIRRHLHREPDHHELEMAARGVVHRRLALFGKDVPELLQSIARESGFDPGLPANDALLPDGIRYGSGSPHEPMSPVSVQRLEEMTSAEILTLLDAPLPEDGPWDEPSRQGLIQALGRFVAEDARRAAFLLEDARVLADAGVLLAILGGVWEAVRQGERAPWRAVIATLENIAVPSTPGHARAEGDWANAQRMAFDVLTLGADQDALPIRDATTAIASLDRVVRSWLAISGTGLALDASATEGDARHEIRQENDSVPGYVPDPVYRAVDAAIGVHRALLRRRVANTQRRERSADTAIETPTRRATDLELREAAAILLPRIEQWLGMTSERSPFLRAALGRRFVSLVALDADWAAAHTDAIFGNEFRVRPLALAWQSYLGSHVLNPNDAGRRVFDIVAANYRRAALAMPRRRPPRSSDQVQIRSADYLLAAHVIRSVIYGWLAVDDETVTTLTQRTSANELAHVYGEMARSVRDGDRHNGDPTLLTELSARAAEFWRARVDALERTRASAERWVETEGLLWFFQLDRIPDAVSIELFARTIHLLPTMGRGPGLWWPKLARLSGTFTAQSVRVAAEMVERTASKRTYSFRRAEVHTIVRAGLRAEDPAVVATARRLGDKLVEGGDEDLLPDLERPAR